MKAFSDIFRSQICIQVGAHGGFPPICICSKDRFNRSRLRSLRHRRAAQGGASGGKQKSLRAQSCMAGSAFLLNIPPISFFAFQIEKSEPRGNVTKNRRFIKNSFDVLLLFRFKVGHQMTPNGKPSSKLKIPCANNTCGFDPAQQGSNQPCGLLLSARETPTTGIKAHQAFAQCR